MDNRTSNNDEKWVEERIARLSPPLGWKPDADKAFERMIRQRGTPTSTPRVLRLSLAGATIAAIGVIVALLPWPMLWTPKTAGKTATNENLARPSQQSVEPGQTVQAAEAVSPPAPQVRENSIVAETAQEPATAATVEPASPATEQTQISWPVRQKKNRAPFIVSVEPSEGEALPRFVAAAAPEKSAEPFKGAGQGQQPPENDPALPVAVFRVQPPYTVEARQARIQGTVELIATVREDGTAKFERITHSLGFGLDEASAAAIEQWKFVPGKKNGQPVAVSLSFRFNFSLK